MKTYTVEMPDGKKIIQQVRGICQFDILNPCWDNRPTDKVGVHWSDLCPACEACTEAAKLHKRGTQ